MKRIKTELVSLIVFFIVLSVGGCNTSQLPKEKEQGSVRSKVTEDKVSINVDSSDNGLPDKLTNPNVNILVIAQGQVEEFQDAVRIFEEKYGGKVSFEIVTLKELDSKLSTSVSSGDTSDIVFWNQKHMPRYIVKNLLTPIENFIDLKDHLWADSLDVMNQFKFQGKYYGISGGSANPFIIFYNKTLFENYGLKTPIEYHKEGKWNWENFRKVGMELTGDTNQDGVIDQWGYTTFVKDLFVLSNSADLVEYEEGGSITLNIKDSKVVEALQFYQDGHYKDKYMTDDLKWSQLFTGGKVGMVADRNGFVKSLAEVKFEWDIAPFPVGPNGIYGKSPAWAGFYGISNGAKNPEGASAMLYLHVKTNKEKGDASLLENYTPEQVKLINELKEKVMIPRYEGIGDFAGKTNAMFRELRQGSPIMSVIEKHTPILQGEIDILLSDGK